MTNNVLGLIYSNAYDSAIPELTTLRTMGSVPFGGRYRMIDFALSNMVNCGITKVGVATKSNYQSLMDHLGSGKPWDLSRKNDGMFILPPFSSSGTSAYTNRVEALKGSMRFIERSNEEYVILCDCNVVGNIDYEKIYDAHIEKNADITIAYMKGIKPSLKGLMSFALNEDGRIENIAVNSVTNEEENYSLNIFVLRKALLERLVNEAQSLHLNDFERDFFQRNVETLKIYGFEEKGFVRVLSSLQSFYDVNMELLDTEKRRSLFPSDRPVFTIVRDEMPTVYGLGSDVKNSLIADGCSIEGTVENCVLFRGVHIGKGAVVKNSIIMQGSYIGENSNLNCIVMDKSAVVKPNKTLSGDKSFPIYIGKEIII